MRCSRPVANTHAPIFTRSSEAARCRACPRAVASSLPPASARNSALRRPTSSCVAGVHERVLSVRCSRVSAALFPCSSKTAQVAGSTVVDSSSLGPSSPAPDSKAASSAPVGQSPASRTSSCSSAPNERLRCRSSLAARCAGACPFQREDVFKAGTITAIRRSRRTLFLGDAPLLDSVAHHLRSQPCSHTSSSASPTSTARWPSTAR